MKNVSFLFYVLNICLSPKRRFGTPSRSRFISLFIATSVSSTTPAYIIHLSQRFGKQSCPKQASFRHFTNTSNESSSVDNKMTDLTGK